MNRQRAFRLSVVSLVMAGLWQASPVRAQDTSSGFLSAIAGVDIPAATTPEDAARPVPAGISPAPDPALQRLKRENRRLREALARKQAGEKGLTAAAERERAALVQKLTALEKQLKEQAPPVVTVPATTAPETVQAELAGLRSQRDGLQLELTQARKESSEHQQALSELQAGRIAADTEAQQRVADLQKQLSDLSGEREALNNQLAQLRAQQQENRLALTVASQRGDVAQAELAGLRSQRDGLQLELKQALKESNERRQALSELQAGRSTSDSEAQQHAATLQKQVSELSLARDDLQQQLTTAAARHQEQAASAESTRTQLAALQKENAALKTAAQTQQQSVQQQATAQTEASATTDAMLKNLTAERDGLKRQLDGLTAQYSPALKTAPEKQAYASGVALAGNLRRTLEIQRDLGADLPVGALMAGLTDGVGDKVRLDGPALQDSYRTLMAKLASREKEKYRAGVSELEKLAPGTKLTKRNGTLFFVRTQKGSGRVSPGDRVQFDLTESVVKGKTLRAEKGVSATLDGTLPYLVEQALTLAGRGGKLTVYCMASDVYPPERMPEGLLPYSLIQYQFTVAKAPGKPAADGTKKQG
ncbi:hypothetical protein GJZ31_04665 [Salmonella enterica]|nr:hypothetical protein [Salmonella enterica]